MIGWGIDLGPAGPALVVIRKSADGAPQEIVDGTFFHNTIPEGGEERRLKRSMRTQIRRRRERIARVEALLRQVLGCADATSAGKSCAKLATKKDGTAVGVTNRALLRDLGLREALTPGDLFKAIVHIAHNRGQRLTRSLKDEADSPEAKESQSAADEARRTKALLAALGEELGLGKPATPGQLLARIAAGNRPIRRTRHNVCAPLFTRSMVEDELRRLLKVQGAHHRGIDKDEVRQQIFAAVFHEAEAPPPRPGLCLYEVRGSDGQVEERLPIGTDLFQRKRIYEECNNLRLRDMRTGASWPLDLEQRNRIADTLLAGKPVTAKTLRKLLDLGSAADAPVTNLEERADRKGRKADAELKPHPGAAAMRRAKLDRKWAAMSPAQRERLMELLREQDDLEAFEAVLAGEFGITEPAAVKALAMARVPRTRSAAGPTATARLLEALEARVCPLNDAEQAAGLTRSRNVPDRRLERLPYYGELFPANCTGGTRDPRDNPETRHGRIPNPVVHVNLNILRKMANSYIKRYGLPDFINVEVARDIAASPEQRDEAERERRNRQKANDDLARQILSIGMKPNPRTMRRARLWKLQQERCLYSGRRLELRDALSEATQVDHILPREDTLDDSLSNLALVTQEMNHLKGKRHPHAAFANGEAGRPYSAILAHVRDVRKGDLWRFQPDAMAEFARRGVMNGRMLGDTRYIARMARDYLAWLTGDPNKVMTVTGAMTAHMRHIWGLDGLIEDIMVDEGRLAPELAPSWRPDTEEERRARVEARKKLRLDHRHHVLDAAVVACITRSDIKRLHTLAAYSEGFADLRQILLEKGAENLFRQGGLPWQKGFRGVMERFLKARDPAGTASRVVHKPDHNPFGQMHKEELHRVIAPAPKGRAICGKHVPLEALTSLKQIEAIGIDDSITNDLAAAISAGHKITWGKRDPLAAMKNLQKAQDQLRESLVSEYNAAAVEGAETMSTEALDKAKAQAAVKAYIERSGQRRYLKVTRETIRILKGPTAKGRSPLRAVILGNNDRLIHWIDHENQPHWDIVTTIDACHPRFQEPWIGNGRLIFRLRKNDIVEMLHDAEDPSKGRGLYRLANLSPNDYQFLPIEDARASNESRGVVTVRCSSRELARRAAVQTVLSPDGRIRYQSERRN